MALDTQVVQIIGKQRLISELLQAGLEAAEPLRDRGVDLIAYDERSNRRFVAVPLQLKAVTAERFQFDAKYRRSHGLIIVFVWHVASPAKAATFALTQADIERIGREMGYDRSPSWRKGSYNTSSPSLALKALLEPFRMTHGDGTADAQRWQALMDRCRAQSADTAELAA